MVDAMKLKGKIIERGYTQWRLAEEARIGRCSMNLKINNKRTFSVAEAQRIGNILNIADPAELAAIFFAPEVADTQRVRGGRG